VPVEISSSANCAALRVAVTVDPEIPVPPVLYGGIERIVDMLVRGPLERGHQVTLFANPNSSIPCDLHPYVALDSRSKVHTLRNMWRTGHCTSQELDQPVQRSFSVILMESNGPWSAIRRN
jgi:hypothetical protein